MTVAVTKQRLDKTLALIQERTNQQRPAPTNYEIALHIGMGEQRFQPYDRTKGFRGRKHEAGSVMVRALEMLGVIEVDRIARRKRVIRIVSTINDLPGS